MHISKIFPWLHTILVLQERPRRLLPPVDLHTRWGGEVSMLSAKLSKDPEHAKCEDGYAEPA